MGALLVGLSVVIFVDEEAPDVALFMVPFGALIGGVVGLAASVVT
jgi:hypothetical protein